MTDFLVVLTATNSKDEAQRIADALVRRRLAASVNVIGPMSSTYWWQGEVVAAEEWLCVVKTQKGCYEELEKLIKGIHSYEVPGIIALPVVAGSESYLEWILRETRM
jgi:periplasmic divalent cation tolerance protein